MAKPKSVRVRVTQREAFALYLHLRNVIVNSRREQDQHDDLWTSCELQAIDDRCELLGRPASFEDFSRDEADGADVELSREEIGALASFTTGKPMTGQLVRYLMPLRQRFEAARDSAGLKAVPDGDAA